jgi:hypothetical protein
VDRAPVPAGRFFAPDTEGRLGPAYRKSHAGIAEKSGQVLTVGFTVGQERRFGRILGKTRLGQVPASIPGVCQNADIEVNCFAYRLGHYQGGSVRMARGNKAGEDQITIQIDIQKKLGVKDDDDVFFLGESGGTIVKNGAMAGLKYPSDLFCRLGRASCLKSMGGRCGHGQVCPPGS